MEKVSVGEVLPSATTSGLPTADAFPKASWAWTVIAPEQPPAIALTGAEETATRDAGLSGATVSACQAKMRDEALATSVGVPAWLSWNEKEEALNWPAGIVAVPGVMQLMSEKKLLPPSRKAPVHRQKTRTENCSPSGRP